jgi:hypothetical protein
MSDEMCRLKNGEKSEAGEEYEEVSWQFNCWLKT